MNFNITKNQKERILKALKGKQKSTSELSVISGLNFYITLNVLNKLTKEGKVVMIKKPRGVFWEVKNE